MKWQALVLLVYALFIITGGMIGYMKAHSHISLFIGSAAGIILLIASLGVYHSKSWGLLIAFGVTGILMFFFGYRFYLKQAFFPAGLMTLLSVITMMFLSFLPRK